MKQQKLNSKEYYINEINRLKEEKRLVEQELKKTQAELYRAHLEKDVYEKAAEILKKEMSDNLKERAMVTGTVAQNVSLLVRYVSLKTS